PCLALSDPENEVVRPGGGVVASDRIRGCAVPGREWSVDASTAARWDVARSENALTSRVTRCGSRMPKTEGASGEQRQRRATMSVRSEVIGSLLRPTYLIEARAQFESSTLCAADFKRVEDQAVREAIALQEAAGIDVITDGEQRRYAFYGHLVESV